MPRTKGAKSHKTLALIDTSRDILAAIHPASVRAVAYQLFNGKLIENMGKLCTDRVSKQLVYAREQGVIPWAWIVDRTRRVEVEPSWDDMDDFLACVLPQYRRDYWVQQSTHVEVWSEKATVAGTLDPVLNHYGVAFRPLHGYNSATAIHDAAAQSQRDPKPWVVLYVGDWDPSGLDMSEHDLPRRIDRYGGLIEISRIALLPDDLGGLARFAFPAADKSGDSRYGWFVARYGERCWELDAMNPNDLRARVDEAIQTYIDDPSAWERCQTTEAAEVESYQKIVDEIRERRGRGNTLRLTAVEILQDPDLATLPADEQTKVRLRLYQKALANQELSALPEPEQAKVRRFILGPLPELSQERVPGRPAGFEVFPPGLDEVVSPGEGEGLLGLLDPGVLLAPENLPGIGAMKGALEKGARALVRTLSRGARVPPTLVHPELPFAEVVIPHREAGRSPTLAAVESFQRSTLETQRLAEQEELLRQHGLPIPSYLRQARETAERAVAEPPLRPDFPPTVDVLSPTPASSLPAAAPPHAAPRSPSPTSPVPTSSPPTRPQGPPVPPVGAGPPPLTEPTIATPVYRKVLAAAEDLLTVGGVPRDPSRQLSDQVLDLMQEGKLALPEMEVLLKDAGLSFTDFADQLFRGGVRDAARRLSYLSRLEAKVREWGAISPEATAELDALKQVAGEADESVKALSWWRRADNIRRGLLVTQLATAVRNAETQAGRVGVDVLQQALDAGIQRVFLPGKVTSHPLDGFEVMLNLFRRGNKAEVNQILHALPKEHDRLFGIYSSDIAAKAREAGMTPAAGKADQLFTAAESVVSVLNTANRGQEFLFRRAVFMTKLEQQLRRKGLDLEDIVANNRVGAIPEGDIKAAVNQALEFTLAASPAFGTVAQKFVSLVNAMPGATLPIPFPRFMVNALKFNFEFSPLGFLKLLSPQQRARSGTKPGSPTAAAWTSARSTPSPPISLSPMWRSEALKGGSTPSPRRISRWACSA